MDNISELWNNYLSTRFKTNYYALIEKKYHSIFYLFYLVSAILGLVNIIPYYFEEIPKSVVLLITITAIISCIITSLDFHSKYEEVEKIKESYQRLGIKYKVALLGCVAYGEKVKIDELLAQEGYLEYRIRKFKISKKTQIKAYEYVLREINDFWGIGPFKFEVRKEQGGKAHVESGSLVISLVDY